MIILAQLPVPSFIADNQLLAPFRILRPAGRRCQFPKTSSLANPSSRFVVASDPQSTGVFVGFNDLPAHGCRQFPTVPHVLIEEQCTSAAAPQIPGVN